MNSLTLISVPRSVALVDEEARLVVARGVRSGPVTAYDLTIDSLSINIDQLTISCGQFLSSTPWLSNQRFVLLLCHLQLLNFLRLFFISTDDVEVVVENVPILQFEAGWVQSDHR